MSVEKYPIKDWREMQNGEGIYINNEMIITIMTSIFDNIFDVCILLLAQIGFMDLVLFVNRS